MDAKFWILFMKYFWITNCFQLLRLSQTFSFRVNFKTKIIFLFLDIFWQILFVILVAISVQSIFKKCHPFGCLKCKCHQMSTKFCFDGPFSWFTLRSLLMSSKAMIIWFSQEIIIRRMNVFSITKTNASLNGFLKGLSKFKLKFCS